MNIKIYIQFLICLLFSSCLPNKKLADALITNQTFETKLDSLNLFDSLRNRSIPVALYLPKTEKKFKKQKVVIFNHGYGGNEGGANKAYSYLTNFAASHGYFVASIQHELATDSLLAMTGNYKITRRPNWERGAENILFVINELKRIYPKLDYKHLILIGHSNGGDMTMLFAHKFPKLVDKVISLDNRRMDLPRIKKPKIYSLRSDDDPADEGVLPTIEEQIKYGINIIHLKNIKHGDMSDYGNENQHKEINKYILTFLND
jgi:predicted peptidase